jgi:threonine/homoserine/homoserine lactone efflux protein
MEFVLLGKGLLVGLLASMPLGPIGILCVQRTLSKGRLSGFVSGMGAATSDTIFAIIAGLGLSFVINFLESKQFFFKIIGGGLIIFLGCKIFFTHPVHEMRKQRAKKNKLIEDYLSVFLLTITNPMYILIFVAMFAGFDLVNDKTNFWNVFVAFSAVFVGASFWWFTLTTIVSRFRNSFRLKRLWWINKITGALIVICGLLAILTLIVNYKL